MSCELLVIESLEQETLLEQTTDLVLESVEHISEVTEAPANELLVERDQDLLIVEQEQTVRVLEVGTQGPPGPPGAAGGAALSLIAGTALGGHRAVRSLAGVAVYADCQALADANLVLGITQGAANSGAPVFVQVMGLMAEPSWSWVADLPVFVGQEGVLTQTPPEAGYRLIVGAATSATQIHIGLKMPIVLE